MPKYDIFACPAGSGLDKEFLALHNYAGDIARVHEFAASRGCRITRIIDISKPLGAPDFTAAVMV